jgi:cytochrome P450
VSSFPIGATVTGEQLSTDPYAVFHRLRPSEPVSWAPAIGQWLVTSRAIGMDVLRDPERFRTDEASSPIRDTFGAQMLSSEGEVQRRYKLACAPPFNARAVDASRELVQSVVDARAALLPRTGAVELRAAYAAPIAVATIARVIGLPASLDDDLRAWYDTFADALMNYERDAGTRDRAHAAVRAFRAAIAPRLAAPDPAEQTLLASLARAYPRLLDDGEIGSNALIVLFGGIETTEALIANVVWALLMHPDALARARASDDDLDRCIEETLRWEPAVQTCTRYVPEPAILHGVAIPPGALVQVMLGGMNRDPAHYADPDRFDPWRPETTPHSAFGFGRHFCLGAALAKLEARLAVRRLFDDFPALALDVARTRPPTGHEFRKPGALVVHVA